MHNSNVSFSLPPTVNQIDDSVYLQRNMQASFTFALVSFPSHKWFMQASGMEQGFGGPCCGDNAAACGRATLLSFTIAACDNHTRQSRVPVPSKSLFPEHISYIPTHLRLVGALVVSTYATYLSQSVKERVVCRLYRLC